jgi:hypothetical protein
MLYAKDIIRHINLFHITDSNVIPEIDKIINELNIRLSDLNSTLTEDNNILFRNKEGDIAIIQDTTLNILWCDFHSIWIPICMVTPSYIKSNIADILISYEMNRLYKIKDYRVFYDKEKFKKYISQ